MSHTAGLSYSERFKERDDGRWQRRADPDSFTWQARSLDLTLTFSSPSLPFPGTQEPEDAPKHMTYLMNIVKIWRSDILPRCLSGPLVLLQHILATVW